MDIEKEKLKLKKRKIELIEEANDIHRQQLNVMKLLLEKQ